MTVYCKCVSTKDMYRRTFRRRVAILIPAYNEAKHLAELIARCRATLPAVICVVDDCSTDDTAGVLAREIAKPGAPVIALRNADNLGKQGSVRRGLRALRGESIDAVALIDGDLQHDPAGLPTLAELLEDHDVVIGARDKSEMPRQRRLSNWLVNRSFAAFAGVDFYDVQSGLRLYRKPMADAIGALLPAGGGFGIEHESLALLPELCKAEGSELYVAAAEIPCRYGDEVSHIGLRDIIQLGVETVRQGVRFRRAMRPPQPAH